MSDHKFECETHSAELYDHAHVFEHECMSRGRCEIVNLDAEIVETPPNSHNDQWDAEKKW